MPARTVDAHKHPQIGGHPVGVICPTVCTELIAWSGSDLRDDVLRQVVQGVVQFVHIRTPTEYGEGVFFAISHHTYPSK